MFGFDYFIVAEFDTVFFYCVLHKFASSFYSAHPTVL